MIIIEKAIKLKKELDSFRPINREDEQRVMQKFRLDWNYHSNNLEGNTLTYGETKALILFGLTAQGKPFKDHFEVKGHDEAIKWVIEVVEQKRPLTENFIRQIHELLLKESYEVDAITPDGKPSKKTISIGKYKKTPNHVKTQTGEIFRFASPEETPALMYDLLQWYREKIEKTTINPILLAAEFHYKFITIHPFDDGNGRTARILMNFVLMQYGYPPVIIKTEDKENYFATLRQADAGTFEPFLNYITSNLIHSLELMIKGLNGESIEEPDDIFKEIAMLEKRLESVGDPLKIVKNKDVLQNIYDNSISKLLTEYVNGLKVFDSFYVKSNLQININNQSETFISLDKLLEFGKENITFDTYQIVFFYHHSTFNRPHFNEFNMSANLYIYFDKLSYLIKRSNEVLLKKNYNENLTSKEIKSIVNGELKIHKEYIEARLKDLENKNNRK
jgi:Fic family protein